MRAWLLVIGALMTPGCEREATPPPAPGVVDAARMLDPLAERYVRLTLAIGEREPGYVDAYYGPKDWAEAAKTEAPDLPALRTRVDALVADLEALDTTGWTTLDQRRRADLQAQLRAAQTRLRMLAGERLPFVDEAEGLFAVRPELAALESFDPVLAEIEALLPGDGELADRVDAALAATAVAPERLEAVMRAAIDACREKTAARVELPTQERCELALVKDKPWSGYNWYQGDAHSLIEINTDLPVLISRALDLGCHEGYPGHHVLNLLLEERLARGRGWIEFTVYPLYSPMSLIAEGTANYGVDLAFPDAERLAFERDVLYPLAGLDPARAESDLALLAARAKLAGARLTIAQQYLDGAIDRDEAIRLVRKYQLVSTARAEQSLRFNDAYRSYVINYGLGEAMVKAHVEAVGDDADARWERFLRLLTEPTLPSDLAP